MPPKRGVMGEEERELERLEDDLVRLTRSKTTMEGKTRYWGQECEKLGGLVIRTRNNLAQQDMVVEEQREAVTRARRALDVSGAGAEKFRRELTEGERKLRASEEALKQARVDAEVTAGLRTSTLSRVKALQVARKAGEVSKASCACNSAANWWRDPEPWAHGDHGSHR